VDIFERTIRGLEAGLKVGDIATFDLRTCNADDDVDEVLERGDLELFSAIPVRGHGAIIGVLERSRAARGRVGEVMRPLNDSLLVAFDEPIKGFIPKLQETPYRLVVRGTQIDGIVTWSDVHKLPVRLLVFVIITHLEMLMAEAIVEHYGEDRWLGALKPKRREKVNEKIATLRMDELDPPLIELTEFADKKGASRCGSVADWEIGTRRARDELRRIEDLRNKVAHASGFVNDHADLQQEVSRMRGQLQRTLSASARSYAHVSCLSLILRVWHPCPPPGERKMPRRSPYRIELSDEQRRILEARARKYVAVP